MRENNHQYTQPTTVIVSWFPLLPTLVKTKLRNSLKVTQDFLIFSLCSTPFNCKQPAIPAYLEFDSDRVFLQFTNTLCWEMFQSARRCRQHCYCRAHIIRRIFFPLQQRCQSSFSNHALFMGVGAGGCVEGSWGHRYPNNTMHYLPDQTFGRHLHAICSITHVWLWKQMCCLSHILQRFYTRVCHDKESGMCHCHQQSSRWRC